MKFDPSQSFDICEAAGFSLRRTGETPVPPMEKETWPL
jgi:hypothetical protein